MTGETVGAALKRWRLHRGLTLRGLGDEVNYSHVYLWEIEKGTKKPTPEIIARCDHKLGAGGQLVAIEARSRRASAAADDERIGLHLGSTWTDCVDTVTELWRHDAGRRSLLRRAMLVPAASPVAWWLDYLEGHQPSLSVDGTDAQHVLQMISTFRRLDNLYGGGEIRPAVVQFLDSHIGPVLAKGTPETLGIRYLAAVAELTHLAGWLAYDSLDHGIGQRYFQQSLQLARWAHDRKLGAEILAGMSHQAIFLRQPKRALSLAHAAHTTAQRGHAPALVAESSLMKAHAYAMQAREEECTSALTEAEHLVANADRAEDPDWIAYFDEAYLAAISGHCFRALGKAEMAELAAQRSLNMSEGYLRGRLFNQLLLAETYVLDPKRTDVERACAVGHRALDLAENLSSGRAIAFIDRLILELQPWHTHRVVKDFIERARTLSV